MITSFDQLIVAARQIRNKRIAVAYANNADTFEAVALAQKEFGLSFDLTGNKDYIIRGLGDANADLSSIDVHDCADPNEAAQKAIDCIRDGKAQILLKGSVDTLALMKLVLREENGLRTGRLFSDVFVFEFPERQHNKLIMITDGGVNPSPGLKEKVELVRNAVHIAHALGNMNPKVAALSASEFVSPKVPSSVDAKELMEMNIRGEITGCTLGGPLALDSALFPEVAKGKGISFPVAGEAEILVCPNIETANGLAKSTVYFPHFRLGHVIVGAKVPVLIPSRADKSDAKLLSIALGLIEFEYTAVNSGT